MKKLILGCFLLFLCITDGFSQNHKYTFSIENVDDARTGKQVMGDYVQPFFNSGENKLLKFNFSEETHLFVIECRQEISREQLSAYLTDKGGLVLKDFKTAD